MCWYVWYARAESGTRHPPASCTKINPSINFPCRRPGLTAEIRRSAALPEISRSQTTDAFCRYPAVFLEIGLSFPGSPLLQKKKPRKKKSDRVQTVSPLSLTVSLQFPLVSLTAFQSRALSNTFFPFCVTPQTNRLLFYFY